MFCFFAALGVFFGRYEFTEPDDGWGKGGEYNHADPENEDSVYYPKYRPFTPDYPVTLVRLLNHFAGYYCIFR